MKKETIILKDKIKLDVIEMKPFDLFKLMYETPTENRFNIIKTGNVKVVYKDGNNVTIEENNKSQKIISQAELLSNYRNIENNTYEPALKNIYVFKITKPIKYKNEVYLKGSYFYLENSEFKFISENDFKELYTINEGCNYEKKSR